MAGLAGQQCQPSHYRYADHLTKVANRVHETCNRTGVALSDINRGGPACGHSKVFDKRRKTQRGESEADVARRKGNADQHEDTAESVGNHALQRASPTRPPESHLSIGEEATKQTRGSAKEERCARGENQSNA